MSREQFLARARLGRGPRRRPHHLRRRQRLRRRARAARAARARADRDVLRRRRPARRRPASSTPAASASSPPPGWTIGCHGMRHRAVARARRRRAARGARRRQGDPRGASSSARSREAACPFGSYDRRVAARAAARRLPARLHERSRHAPAPTTGCRRATRVGPTTTPACSSTILRPTVDHAALPPAREAGGEAVAVTVAPRVRVRPITDADVRARRRVPARATSTTRVPAEHWARALDVPWDVEQPNAGFMLLDGDDGRRRAPRVLLRARRSTAAASASATSAPGACSPELPLPQPAAAARRCSRQDGYHFTDLSPSGNVVELNERLGFRFLDTTTALVPNLPWPSLAGPRPRSAPTRR